MGNSRLPGSIRDEFHCYSRNRGPLGRNDGSDPHIGDALPGDTPGPLGRVDAAAPPVDAEDPCETEVKLLVLGLGSTSALLQSTALAIEQQAAIKVNWKEYKDSTLINLLYYFHDAKPGMAEIDFGNQQQIATRTAERYEKMCDTFVKKCAEGPASLTKYLNQVEKTRNSALDSVRQSVNDVQSINSEIISQVDKTVAQLKMIQAGSTIILAGAVIIYSGGALAGAAWATTSTAGFLGAATAGKLGGVYLGYELSVAVAKNWDEGAEATAIAIGKEAIEEIGEETGKILDKSGKANLGQSSGYSQKVKVLEKKIANQQKKIASVKAKKAAGKGTLPKAKQKNLSNRAARYRQKAAGYKKGVKVSKQAAKTSKAKGLLKRGAGATLQIVFAANDIYEAVIEFGDAFNDYQKADK